MATSTALLMLQIQTNIPLRKFEQYVHAKRPNEEYIYILFVIFYIQLQIRYVDKLTTHKKRNTPPTPDAMASHYNLCYVHKMNRVLPLNWFEEVFSSYLTLLENWQSIRILGLRRVSWLRRGLRGVESAGRTDSWCSVVKPAYSSAKVIEWPFCWLRVHHILRYSLNWMGNEIRLCLEMDFH